MAPTPILNIAWSTAPFADTPSWDDVTADLVMFSYKRGRQHELDRFEAGTMTLLLKNINGDYWNLNSEGAYWPDVDIGKKVRLQATYGETTYDLFTGYIESMRPGWLSDRGGRYPVMKINCADAIAIFSRARLNKDSGYDPEASGPRIEHILTDVGFPDADRTIDVGQFAMIATGAIENKIAQAHIFEVAESEIGLFYMGADGKANFEDRAHRTNSPHDSSLATFNNTFADINLALDDKLLYNEIRATRSEGTEQVATDSTSQTNYGPRTLVRSGLLLTTDGLTRAYAYFLLARYNTPIIRAESITIEPLKTPATFFPQVLGYDISSRITVQHSDGSINSDYFIEGIQQDFDSRVGRWTTKWQLSDATRYLYTPEAIEDTLRPNANGDFFNIAWISQFPDEGEHWEKVDEETADEDETYMQADDEAGYTEALFEMEDIPYSCTINKVTVYARVKWDGTDRDIPSKTLIKTGGVVYYGDDEDVGMSWETISTEYVLNPGGGEWTVEQVNASQAGCRLFGGTAAWNNRERCTQVYVIVNYTLTW